MSLLQSVSFLYNSNRKGLSFSDDKLDNTDVNINVKLK